MKLFLVFFITILLAELSFSQTLVYRGDRANSNDLIYQITPRKIARMNNSLWGNDVLFIRQNEVYEDVNYFTCRYTIEGNKIYKGQSNSVFDLLYEIENGKVYQVSNSSLRKCLYTFRKGEIFLGDSTSAFDLLFNFSLLEDSPENELLIFLAIAPF